MPARRSDPSILKRIHPEDSLEGLLLKLRLQYFDHLMGRASSLEKKPWCWERLKVGREGDDRGWGGWMASPTQRTWVWASSGSWWWTGRPGVLQSTGSLRVTRAWATEQQQLWALMRDQDVVLSDKDRVSKSTMPATLCVYEKRRKGENIRVYVAADFCTEHSAGRPRNWQRGLSQEQVLVSFFSKGQVLNSATGLAKAATDNCKEWKWLCSNKALFTNIGGARCEQMEGDFPFLLVLLNFSRCTMWC